MNSAYVRIELDRAADAVVTAIRTLQLAQETQWQSMAAEVMREELYSCIQLLRGVGDAIADAMDDVGVVTAELGMLDLKSLECSA